MDLSIHMNRGSGPHRAGDLMEGFALVKNTKPKNKFVKYISLTLTGSGYVKWKGCFCCCFFGYGIITRQKVYSSSHTYLDNTFYILQATELPQGEHKVPFSFELPENLPSSFEGPSGSETGYIRYKISAKMVTNNVFSEKAGPDRFNVLGQINPFNFPNLINPTILQQEGKSGSFSVYFPASAFSPGQAIPYQASAINKKSKIAKGLEIFLLKHIRYHVGPKSRDVSTEMIVQNISLDFGPSETRVWDGFLELPKQLTLSDLGGCGGIISVEYFLKVKWMGLKDSDLIIISSIPIISAVDEPNNPDNLGVDNPNFSSDSSQTHPKDKNDEAEVGDTEKRPDIATKSVDESQVLSMTMPKDDRDIKPQLEVEGRRC